MQGIVQDFRTRVTAQGHHLRVGYDVVIDDQEFDLTDWRGLVIRFLGGASCKHCGKPTESKAGREYCYACFTTLARCDLCVMSPDRCHFHAGTCREPEWGEEFCMRAHTVYLALSHVPKVGITRQGREWYRWADQGAYKAIKILSVPTRRMAGVMEAYLSKWLTDRTDWRKLVTGQRGTYDLQEIAQDLRQKSLAFDAIAFDQISPDEIAGSTWLEGEREYDLTYPVQTFTQAEQLRVDAHITELADKLVGVIGGYLLLSQGVIAMSNLIRGDIEIERKDDVVVPERPQLKLF